MLKREASVTAFHFRVSLAPVTLALLLTLGPVQPERCSSSQLLRSMHRPAWSVLRLRQGH